MDIACELAAQKTFTRKNAIENRRFLGSCPYNPVKQQLQGCPHYDVDDQNPGDPGIMFQHQVLILFHD